MSKSTALVTASYHKDFSRCKLLCETIDRHVSGHTCHYLLVDPADEKLFSQLAGPKRKVITDRELLPWWLVRIPGRIAPGGRPFWISPYLMPLHGWQVQQLRRIAVAHVADEDGFIFCDSDTMFVKPLDVARYWQDGKMRMVHEKDGADGAKSNHLLWLDHAARTLGLDAVPEKRPNYIVSFIGWRGDTMRAMCERIETVTGRHWINGIATSRQFSECMLYGTFVDGVLNGEGHFMADESLCNVQWFNPPPTRDELYALIRDMSDEQVGIGIQSFIEIDEGMLREAVTS